GWSLTPAQLRTLEKELAHTHDAALLRRLLAVLEVGQGRSTTEVAQWLRVNRRSVYRWVERFAASHRPEALSHQRGQGRPRIWSEDLAQLLASALAQSPRQLGYSANTWTVPVLQAFLAVYLPGQEVSARTVRRRLRESGYVWKRFRHVLAPDPEAEKKTPAFAANSSFARAYGTLGRG
ncbi:MAG: transposase, partial [Pedosphaera sp.]|nr:transposase [Pedosphaera sp.]